MPEVATGAQQFASPDLGDQAGRVEVDALVDDPLPFEEEDRNDRDAKRLACRGQSVELAEICSQQVKFDDHRVVRDVKSGIVVTLVRKRGSRREVVTHDLGVAIEDLAGGHDLVMGMAVEGGQGFVEVLGDLGVHVLLNDREAAAAEVVGNHLCSWGLGRAASTSRRASRSWGGRGFPAGTAAPPPWAA